MRFKSVIWRPYWKYESNFQWSKHLQASQRKWHDVWFKSKKMNCARLEFVPAMTPRNVIGTWTTNHIPSWKRNSKLYFKSLPPISHSPFSPMRTSIFEFSNRIFILVWLPPSLEVLWRGNKSFNITRSIVNKINEMLFTLEQ